MNEAKKQPSRFERLMALQDEVFSEWMSRVRAEVNRAQGISSAILIDTLPMFYKHLAALATGEASTYDRSTIATEHGGERARLTGFDAHSIAHELHLFRATILSVWRQAKVHISDDEVARVDNAIDVATRDTIAGFVLAQASFREQFFAALTHDLRTPIGTAGMAVELIGETTDVQRVRTLSHIIAKQLNLMSKMIDDLLDTMAAHANTARALEFAETDLLALSKDVIENATLTSQREITLRGAASPGMWSEPALRRAMENLLNNAVKYSNSGTPIHVEISEFDGRVNWKVSNQGDAIPEDQIEALFQLFRRVEADKSHGVSGWGIGLPYVRSVAERHGGSVIVESNKEQTSFAIDIPIDPRPILAAATQSGGLKQ